MKVKVFFIGMGMLCLSTLAGQAVAEDSMGALAGPVVEENNNGFTSHTEVGIRGFLRGEGVKNFRLPESSFQPNHGEGRFLYRVNPYASWHSTEWFDIHLEGQGYGYTGGTQYQGKYALYQGYIEGRQQALNNSSLKLGRQEFNYGSAFILGSDSFYKGLSFDAARVRLIPSKAITIDILGGWYATPFSAGTKGYLLGGYATWAPKDDTSLDLYVMRDNGSSNRHSGEYRSTWGMRGATRIGNISAEIEPVLQTGRLFNASIGENEKINAYGGHADLRWDTAIGNHPNHFFASYAYGSGSTDSATGTSARKEFSNPLNDTSLTGDMGVVGDLSGLDVGDLHASGLQVFTAGWGTNLTEKLSLSAVGRHFRANKVADGLSRNIGLETDITMSYAINENMNITLGYDRFFTGRFFRDAGESGKDIHYYYTMLQFNLAHKISTASK